MRALSRTALIGAASAALTLGAGIPVGAASAADAATPGWRQVKVFDCQGANGLWITANGPRNAWASGFCGPTLAHWNGQSWREVSLPSRFGGFETDPAIATLSGSYVWTFAETFAGLRASYALLRNNNRWRTFNLANNSQLTSAVVFSRTNAWAFGSIGAAAYVIRFNGQTWRRVTIPVVPQATAAPRPGNIWAVGAPATAANGKSARIFTLAHWTGRWTTHPLPNLHLASGQSLGTPSVVTDGSGGAWITATIVQLPRADAAGGVLLHWTGRTWNRAQIPFKTLGLGPLAHDGHGGLWMTSFIPNASQDDFSMLHLTRAGTWTSTVLNVEVGLQLWTLNSVRLIPGTDSLWAGGSVLADSDTFPVILKYGP